MNFEPQTLISLYYMIHFYYIINGLICLNHRLKHAN
jgi:hypothetical protein